MLKPFCTDRQNPSIDPRNTVSIHVTVLIHVTTYKTLKLSLKIMPVEISPTGAKSLVVYYLTTMSVATTTSVEL